MQKKYNNTVKLQLIRNSSSWWLHNLTFPVLEQAQPSQSIFSFTVKRQVSQLP